MSTDRQMGLSRRQALRLFGGGSIALLAGCQSPAPPVPTSTVVAPTVTPVVQTATPVPATATAVPVPTAAPTATPLPKPTPSPTAAAPRELAAAIDVALQQGIQRGQTPSGVVVIRQHGRELLRAAYGHSYAFDAKEEPAAQPITATVDTLYDLASLTKLFTATCVMRLVEQGRVALDEPVARYVSDFGANGKGGITVRQLLTHVGGLAADIPLWESPGTPAERMLRALQAAATDPPGRVYRYSDVGFIALGRLVEEIGGLALQDAVHSWVTEPLGLASVQFKPAAELRPRIAATEDASDPPRGLVWGEVHDPSAWSLGGIAGHAGLFGVAHDIASFGQSFLDGSLLKKDTIAEMTRSQIGKLASRGLGWELDESFYMGKLAAPSTYGHTGFTGTSLFVEPNRELVVVLLTNRVHPSVDGPSVNPVRQDVANAAAALPATVASKAVQTGVNVLKARGLDALRGKRLGLVTNQTGRDAAGVSTIDVLFNDKSWGLQALFSPEHGIRGSSAAGESIDSTTDQQTGLPVYSLYGQTTRPTPDMLRGLDVLVYDIQDVGARVYTYTSTLLEIMRAGLPVVVLDRPNPINGADVDGTVLDPRFTSFVGAAPIAMRYGMTIGELARYFNTEMPVGTDLTVVPMSGWQRTMWFDETGLDWVNPSPNIRSLTAATLYPGTVLFEGTALSEGRGTDRPFEWVGAPELDAGMWAARLNAASLPGVRFSAASRTPDSSKHAGLQCQGVLIDLVDRSVVQPMAMAVTMLAACPAQVGFAEETFDGLAGTDQLRLALQAGRSAAEIVASWQAPLTQFKDIRARYLLY